MNEDKMKSIYESIEFSAMRSLREVIIKQPTHCANAFIKMGDVIGRRTALRAVAAPYFRMEQLVSVDPGEERQMGTLLLTLKNAEFFKELANVYRKATIEANRKADKHIEISEPTVECKIYRHNTPTDRCTVELSIYYNAREASSPLQEPQRDTFFYVGEIHRDPYPTGMSDFGSDEDSIPDVEERSIASPVFLLNARDVKNAFKVTVKENPEQIYIMARWAGWSAVKFYGGQVLLIADIQVL